MKIKIIIALWAMLFALQMPAMSQKETKTDKETKLTTDERVVLMTRELSLTTDEQTQVKLVLTNTQQQKTKIKTLNLKKKEEKARVEKLKDLQKAKLKKILGAKRFSKYLKLKKEDVF